MSFSATDKDADLIAPAVREFMALDLVPLVSVTLAAAALSLLGSFLVLRRQAMLGDAMAHSVLPGLVIAFLVTGLRSPLPMLAGALGAALLATAAISAITRFGRVEQTTAIGLVYTTLFALGVFLVETAGPRNVDLDIDCVLSGQLELLFWSVPERWSDALARESLATLPDATVALAVVLVVSVSVVVAAWPLLRAVTFDPTFSQTRGLRPGVVSTALLVLTTAAIVASFDALGSILVIALLTCPPATARLVTDRLGRYVALSAALGAGAGVAGYLGATRLAPLVVGGAVDASGSVAALAGATLLTTAAVVASKRRAV